MTTTVETAPMHPQLEDLHNAGAEQVDPVRFCYLEALARRLRAKGLQDTRHWLKLDRAVADFQANCESPARCSQTIATSPPSPLSALLDRLNQTADTPATELRSALEQLVFGAPEEGSESAQPGATAGTPRPLKAMSRVKTDRSVRALQDRIRHAIEHAPKDAGPINAHRLVSRAIAEMQKLSPEYLDRFVNYTDTLMALEKLGRKG